MGRVLEGVQHGGAVPMREIQFTWGVGGEVVGYDAVDFGAERLDGDCSR